MPRATIAVVTRDRAHSLRRCLDAVCAQDHPDFEVLVVDNASTDDTREVVLGANCSYVFADSRLGIGACRALAVERAQGELVAFCDDDCVPGPSWLRAFDEALAEDPRTALAGGRVINIGFESEKQFKGLSLHWRNGKCRFVTDPQQAQYFGNMNLAMRRSLILELGNYDPFMNVMEELDLAERVREAGYVSRYVAEAVLEHHHTGLFFKRRQKLHGPEVCRLYFFLRHHRPMKARAWAAFLRTEIAFLYADLRKASRSALSGFRRREWPRLSSAIRGLTTASFARLVLPLILMRAVRRRRLARPN